MLLARRIIVFFLFFVIVFCITKNSVLYVLYEVDTKVFVNLFCQNKARLELKCNGKCKLAKMAKDQERINAEKLLLCLQEKIFLYYQKCLMFMHEAPFVEIPLVTFVPFADNHYSYLYLYQIDKPPKFLS